MNPDDMAERRSRVQSPGGRVRPGLRSRTLARVGGLLLLFIAAATQATPIVPSRDDEVIEVLPAGVAGRAEARRARKELAARPSDPAVAVRIATRYLEQARESGDPRFVGLALAAIAAWNDDARAPDAVLLLKATLQQYLHEFDAAAQNLQLLVARPGPDARAQAWLTLATVRRVQGRYVDSDQACEHLVTIGAALHGRACLAENAALRGQVGSARKTLDELLSQGGLAFGTQAWLLTTLAELEQREGRAADADAAFKAVMQRQPDAYVLVAYADFLIEQRRPREAVELLRGHPRTDPVLLRLAIAGTQARTPEAARDVTEMRERIALANERPEARKFHGREQAMFALEIDHAPALALDLARGNVEQQREPLDLLVLAQAARASGDRAALDEAKRLQKSIGLHDRRIDALL